MYLKPNSKKKEFYSEAKRRQLRRNQAQSLHFDSHSRDKEDERLVIRTTTEYVEEVPSGISKYQHPKTKFQKLRNQNRITLRNVKERPLWLFSHILFLIIPYIYTLQPKERINCHFLAFAVREKFNIFTWKLRHECKIEILY